MVSDGRSYHSSIYGMADMPIEDLVQLGGSWINTPEMKLQSNQESMAVIYDRSQKAYLLRSDKGHVDGIKAKHRLFRHLSPF